jgi:TRAP-type C4-dicarboxylate transport system substrate-binding protein
MRKIFLITLAALILITGNSLLFAQRGTAQNNIEVRFVSPLPRESPWGRSLDRIAAEWGRITNNQVRVRVQHGGPGSNEGTMHLSLAANNIQGAVFTSFGLASIYPTILTMNAPFLIRTQDELDAVMNEVQADLEAQINSGDYFIVAWSKAGFVNIFSREPIHTPDDLRRQRIASNVEAQDLNTAFKTMGFQVVESEWTDIGPRLASGAITSIYNNPAAVAAFNLHAAPANLRNMLSINLAPVIGGIVVNQVTWRRIGALNPRFQPELVRVTRQIAAELDQSMQRTVNDAITAMGRGGLTVNRPNASQEQLWYDEVERVTPALLGTTYDRDLYLRINDILTRHRAGQ